MGSTIKQSLTLITFMLFEKNRTVKKCLPWRTLNRPNTDHYIDSHFSCESKTEYVNLTVPHDITPINYRQHIIEKYRTLRALTGVSKTTVWGHNKCMTVREQMSINKEQRPRLSQVCTIKSRVDIRVCMECG